MLEFKNSRHVTASADGEPNTFQIDVEGWPVTVSTKLNLIVGRRGSGKTFLLNHINNQYGNGTDAVAYIQQFKSSEATERFLADESARIAGQARERWVESHKLAFDSMVRFYKDETSDNVETYLGSLKRFAHEVVNTNIARKVKIFRKVFMNLQTLNKRVCLLKSLKK